ncbi:MAG TPA: ATP-binding protein [Ignavibacteriales bacterium]|nr:ATP-binding protein [Ignavibacteriales bacterium]
MEQEKTILLVEDDAIIALLEIKWLAREGFEVIHATSGEDAIEAVRKSPGKIDLILMDIDLGRGAMDGTEAARIILKGQDIPLLFLSSHTEKEIVEKTETISSYGYVVKGSDKTVLMASIKMAFKLFNANQRLAESKEIFEQMYLQSATSTQILDADGWCVRINPKLSELFGVRPEDIEGKVYNIFNDNEIKRNGIDLILRRVFEEKVSADWEVFFDIGIAADSQNIKVKQKTKLWFKNKAWPILDKSGNLLNVIIQHENISEIKQMEELYKTLMQTIPFGIDIVDESGNVLFINEVFEKKFGKESIGKKCWGLYRKDKTQCEGCPLHFGIRIGETAVMQTNDSKSDTVYEILHTGMYYKGKKAMLEIFRDITNRKKTEAQLNRYARELETANETKDKFFSILAHDLKGPFNGFLGMTGELKNNLNNLDEKEITEYAFVLNSHARRLYELLNDLLDWSLLQSDRMEFQPVRFNICNEIQNTIGLFYPAATSKSIFITNEVNVNSTVYADQNMVSTILRNLISNSIKFTNEGGRIHITSKQGGDFLEISVSDSGIGIDYEIMERIFRLDSLHSTKGTNNEDGSGLGLILCKELVKKNGGKIRVESTPKKGTVFTFTLPLSIHE